MPAEVHARFRIKPGEQLNYVQRLQDRGHWPPAPVDIQRLGDDKQPPARPFLVAPLFPGDQGDRSLPDDYSFGAFGSTDAGIQIIDEVGNPVVFPDADKSYTLRCHAFNHGAVGAFAGIVEFYVVLTRDVAALVRNPALATIHGIGNFVAEPGETVSVDCLEPWPAGSIAAAPNDALPIASIVVIVYDLLTDPVIAPFDALKDRHVGRLDTLIGSTE